MGFKNVGDFFDWYHENGILPNIWKGATGQLSNENIADDNLEYQRERNEIEDTRYTEELGYNRAFAENERDYNRAFQEEMRDYGRLFAENDRDYNRDFAENERAYSRAFAENERRYQRNLTTDILNYDRGFAQDERDYSRLFAEDERDYQRNLTADINSYNRNFAEEEQAYNRAFAEEEQAYNRAFAEEEQSYNRAWQENERDYNRALQQKLFEREDTALQRQADSLSSLGINPLSQVLNGLGSGSVVSSTPHSSMSYSPMHYGSSSAPGASLGSSGYSRGPAPSASRASSSYSRGPAPGASASGLSSSHSQAPNGSNRSGNPLRNDMRYEGMMPLLSALGSVADTVNGIKTGQYQRDSLALQNDAMYLQNLEKANDLGLNYSSPNTKSRSKLGFNSDTNKAFSSSKNYSNFKKANEIRNIKHDTSIGLYDSDIPQFKALKQASSMDFTQLTENILTNAMNTYDYLSDAVKGKGNSSLNKFLDLFNFTK